MTKRKLLEEREQVGTWGNISLSRLDFLFKYAGRKILDVGCATGSYVRLLLARGYDAYGIDLLPSPQWIEIPEGRLRQGDIQDLPFKDREFDSVTAFEVLEHVENIDNAIEELKRVARKNIILSVPNCERLEIFKESGLVYHHWVDRTHVHFFTATTLREKLEEHGLLVRYLDRINPVRPGLLLLEGLSFLGSFRWLLASWLKSLPFARPFRMTLIAVAEKSES
jgi:2-polyprenyl-3-methyl-5-hydroxy-6-metoxy-1,4-benzoquinol methylase